MIIGFVIIVVCLAWGSIYLALSQRKAASGSTQRESLLLTRQALEESSHLEEDGMIQKVEMQGEQLYNRVCAACHKNDGKGIRGVFPPLAGSEWVTGAPENTVKILLHGLNGRLDIDGTEYNAAMPAFGNSLNDESIQSIVNYIRNSWGNQAGEITASFVADIRAKTSGQRHPYKVADLK